MDPQVQASFIPKKSLDPAAARGSGYGLLFLISILVFITSLVAAGGSFLYQQYLHTVLEQKKVSLEKSQGAYEPGTIQDLARMDQRIAQAKMLMEKHIAPSAIFNFLSSQTLEKVSFDQFQFTLENTGVVSISMTGKGDSFSTVALQSDQFGSSKVLKNVVFTDIRIGQGGGVTFGVSATVDPSLVSYRATIESTPQSQ